MWRTWSGVNGSATNKAQALAAQQKAIDDAAAQASIAADEARRSSIAAQQAAKSRPFSAPQQAAQSRPFSAPQLAAGSTQTILLETASVDSLWGLIMRGFFVIFRQ